MLTDLWAPLSAFDFTSAFAQTRQFVEAVATPQMLGAFLAGVVAFSARARLLILGAALLLATHLAISAGFLAGEPDWLVPLSVGLAILGLVQAAATLIVGERYAGAIVGFVLLGALAYLFLKGPRLMLTRFFRRE